MDRRIFMTHVTQALWLMPFIPPFDDLPTAQKMIPGVEGEIDPRKLGTTLIHEHIMVDFIGAKEVGKHRYNVAEVVARVLPYLQEVKKSGCDTFVDCTPAFLGRDVEVLQQLARKSKLNILTNTGYYGALDGKYLPAHAFEESAQELAARWIKEAKKGIDGTNIYPAFIKIGVNKGPLSAMDIKLVEAAAYTHLETGLTISAHTGDGRAALDQVEILQRHGVHPTAFRWVHAQNEKDISYHLAAAEAGTWVEYDGISETSSGKHISFLQKMKTSDFLSQCLISQDRGWYSVGEENGGSFKPYTYLFEYFLKDLQESGFSRKEIRMLMAYNPRASLSIGVRI